MWSMGRWPWQPVCYHGEILFFTVLLWQWWRDDPGVAAGWLSWQWPSGGLSWWPLLQVVALTDSRLEIVWVERGPQIVTVRSLTNGLTPANFTEGRTPLYFGTGQHLSRLMNIPHTELLYLKSERLYLYFSEKTEIGVNKIILHMSLGKCWVCMRRMLKTNFTNYKFYINTKSRTKFSL